MLMPSDNIVVNPSPSSLQKGNNKIGTGGAQVSGSGMTPTSSENNLTIRTTKLKKASSYVSSINGDEYDVEEHRQIMDGDRLSYHRQDGGENSHLLPT